MITIEVQSMSCAHCVETITRAIKESIPQASVDIDLAHHLVYVEGTTDLELLKRVIREVGYTPALKQ